MPRKVQSEGDMLQGALDMLILKTLLPGAAQWHAIAHAIERGSREILQVERSKTARYRDNQVGTAGERRQPDLAARC
jgi:hypothetical protein